MTLNIAGARAAADASTARWKAGATLSPIDGMPVGIKDIMETADMATEQGSPLFVGWHGKRDCAAVAALREAGAVVLGKTVTTEFASSHPSRTRNPWDPARTPGGSSSGSAAAVGIGMIPAALGSQVIGSIIRPASFCGCVGFKPSVGSINRGGSFDHFSQSCTGVLGALPSPIPGRWRAPLRCVLVAIRAIPASPDQSSSSAPAAPYRPPETAGWPEASAAAKQALAVARQRPRPARSRSLTDVTRRHRHAGNGYRRGAPLVHGDQCLGRLLLNTLPTIWTGMASAAARRAVSPRRRTCHRRSIRGFSASVSASARYMLHSTQCAMPA